MTTTRLAEEADIPTLAELLWEMEGHWEGETAMSLPKVGGRVRDAAFGPRPCARFLLAEEAGFGEDGLAGLACLSETFPTAGFRRGLLLTDLYVRDGARGQGVGRALLDAALDYARLEGFSRLDWIADMDDSGECGFYERAGHQPIPKLVYRAVVNS